MTISPQINAREIVLAALAAATPVTALIPAARHYPQKVPAEPIKPFLRYGVMGSTPVRAAGWSIGEVSGPIHVHVDQSETIPDPESYCSDVVTAIATVLDDLPDAFVRRTEVTSRDDENEQFHGMVFFELTTE